MEFVVINSILFEAFIELLVIIPWALRKPNIVNGSQASVGTVDVSVANV